MAFPTRSNSRPNARAWLAVGVGVLAVVVVPAAIAVAHYRGLSLLHAAWAAVPAFLLTIGRVGGRRVTRIGRLLGALGIYLALAAALSVGVYELLNRLSA